RKHPFTSVSYTKKINSLSPLILRSPSSFLSRLSHSAGRVALVSGVQFLGVNAVCWWLDKGSSQSSNWCLNWKEETVEEFEQSGMDPLTISLYYIDLDRAQFLLRSFLRIRLQKELIEDQLVNVYPWPNSM
ncbi:hypothetical protein Ddye_024085, partial [Dipteronia dyeriana]